MSTARLTLEDVAKGLEFFTGRYQAIDVFADDIQELRTLAESSDHTLPSALTLVDAAGHRFVFTSQAGKKYRLEIIADHGVARMTVDGATTASASTAAASAIGGAIGAAIGAATSAKGEHWRTGLLLGMLAGAILAPPKPIDENRIFALRFNPETRAWESYQGGLVRWMKEQLLVKPG